MITLLVKKRRNYPLKFSLLVVLTFLTALAIPGKSCAVEVENLYIGKILVTDRTQKTRVKAHRWAIEQVLTKVTGSRLVLENPDVKREVRLRTANYIKSFTFVTDEQKRSFLVDEFDQQKIDRLLRDVGASIWGQRRPQTLVWLVIEEGLRRSIIDEQSSPQIAELLLQASDNRGLPLLMPNTLDVSQVSTSDVWAKFDHIMDGISAQYGSEHYVMARMYYQVIDKQEGWVLDFQLMAGRKILLKQEFQGEQFDIVREMINSLGDYFASQYSIKSEVLGQKTLTMTIEGINNVVDLVNVERYLVKLPPVSKLELQTLKTKQAEFVVHLSGQGLDVIKALDLLDEFVRIEEVVAVEQNQLSVSEQLEQLRQSYVQQEQTTEGTKQTKGVTVLRYRWVP